MSKSGSLPAIMIAPFLYIRIHLIYLLFVESANASQRQIVMTMETGSDRMSQRKTLTYIAKNGTGKKADGCNVFIFFFAISHFLHTHRQIISGKMNKICKNATRMINTCIIVYYCICRYGYCHRTDHHNIRFTKMRLNM